MIFPLLGFQAGQPARGCPRPLPHRRHSAHQPPRPLQPGASGPELQQPPGRPLAGAGADGPAARAQPGLQPAGPAGGRRLSRPRGADPPGPDRLQPVPDPLQDLCLTAQS